jgi:hypothetical protein
MGVDSVKFLSRPDSKRLYISAATSFSNQTFTTSVFFAPIAQELSPDLVLLDEARLLLLELAQMQKQQPEHLHPC